MTPSTKKSLRLLPYSSWNLQRALPLSGSWNGRRLFPYDTDCSAQVDGVEAVGSVSDLFKSEAARFAASLLYGVPANSFRERNTSAMQLD